MSATKSPFLTTVPSAMMFVIFICQMFAALAFSEPLTSIELFAWSSPVVVTVTRNCPLIGEMSTSDFVVVPDAEKYQTKHTRITPRTE